MPFIRVRQAARRARAGAAPDTFGWPVDRAVHDLRNSLSAIRIGVELMNRTDGTVPSPSAAVLAHIDSAAQRAHALSDELADACRLASGLDLVLHPRRFGLHAAVRQALDALPGSAAAIEHDRLGEGDCTADPSRIARFIALAIDEITASAPSALVIVISEVANDRFRIAVHGDGTRRAALPPGHRAGAWRAGADQERLRFQPDHRRELCEPAPRAGRGLSPGEAGRALCLFRASQPHSRRYIISASVYPSTG